MKLVKVKRIYIAASLLAMFSGNVMPNECLGCHKIEGKDIGPSFRDIAREYSKDKRPLEKLTDTIYVGTFNSYQPQGIDMEGTSMLSNMRPTHMRVQHKDAKAMAEWILSLTLHTKESQ